MATMDFADLILSAVASLFVTSIDKMTESIYLPLCFSFSDVRVDPFRCINSETSSTLTCRSVDFCAITSRRCLPRS